MKHRSDKFLRQDLLIPCLFDTISRQAINAELQSLQELEELEKTGSKNDKEAILTQRLIHAIKDKYKIETMHSGKILQAMIFHKITDHCKEFMLESELQARMNKLLKACFADINQIFLQNELKPDKIILICLRIVEILNEEGFNFPEYIQDLFDIFLQIEHLHNINSDVKQWQLVKKSADKQAVKYINKLQQYKYFIKL